MVKLTPSLVYVRTKNSVENVTQLNLWGCEVDDIELCAQMPKLQILSLSVNRVSSLEPLQHCQALEELYIRKNRLSDIEELRHLRDLPRLRVLWIEENPCTDNNSYRNKVIQMLPQITTLDNLAVNKGPTTQDVEDPVHSSAIVDTVHPMASSISLGYSLAPQPQEESRPEWEYSDEEQQERVALEAYRSQTLGRTKSLMNTCMSNSFMASDGLSNDWEDFSLDEESGPVPPMMFQSLHEGVKMPRGYASQFWAHAPGRTLTRKRLNARSQSVSPARHQRVENIMSAVRVLLDELDQEGLRVVIDEAQRRIKKKR